MSGVIERGKEAYWRLVNRKNDYEATFETPHGRRVLKDLLKTFMVFDVTHQPGDPETSTYHNGARGAGLYIVRQLSLTEEELMSMAKERADHD